MVLLLPLSWTDFLNGFPERLTAVLIKVEKAEQVARSRILTKIHAVFFSSQKISGMQFICIHLRKHLYLRATCQNLLATVKTCKKIVIIMATCWFSLFESYWTCRCFKFFTDRMRTGILCFGFEVCLRDRAPICIILIFLALRYI